MRCLSTVHRDFPLTPIESAAGRTRGSLSQVLAHGAHTLSHASTWTAVDRGMLPPEKVMVPQVVLPRYGTTGCLRRIRRVIVMSTKDSLRRQDPSEVRLAGMLPATDDFHAHS